MPVESLNTWRARSPKQARVIVIMRTVTVILPVVAILVVILVVNMEAQKKALQRLVTSVHKKGPYQLPCSF